jgi:hypothetical protein
VSGQGETVTRLERFQAPYGREVELQEVLFEGGMKLLRLRIREGRRFTIMDLDPETAARWARVMGDWAARSRPPEPDREP